MIAGEVYAILLAFFGAAEPTQISFLSLESCYMARDALAEQMPDVETVCLADFAVYPPAGEDPAWMKQ